MEAIVAFPLESVWPIPIFAMYWSPARLSKVVLKANFA
jgi:hypothetical protein